MKEAHSSLLLPREFSLTILLVLAFIMISGLNSSYGQNTTESDSIRTLFQASDDWDTKAELAYQYTVRNLGRDYHGIRDLYLEVLTHEDALKSPTNQFNANNVLGVVYQAWHNQDSSNYYLLRAKQLAEEQNDSTLLMKAATNIAINYMNTGQYSEALEISMPILDISKARKDSVRAAKSMGDIGNCHCYMENYDLCLEWHRKALTWLSGTRSEPTAKGNAYAGISYAYEKTLRYDSAYHYALLALKVQKEHKLYYAAANSQAKVCNLLSQLDGTQEDRLNCFYEQLEVVEALGNPQNICVVKMNIGQALNNLSRVKESIPYTLEALDLANQMQDHRLRFEAYQSLARRYQNLKEYKQAYLYSDSAFDLQDTIRGMEVQNTVLDMQEKYETAEKERALLEEQNRSQKLAKDNAEAELVISNRDRWIYGLLAAILLLVSAAALVIQRNRRKAEQKRQEALLAERDRGLKAVMQAQEDERRRISKDLHDGVGQQLTALKMAWKQVAPSDATNDAERLDKLTKLIDDSAQDVRTISHQMMPRALRELGLSEALNDLFEGSFGAVGLSYQFEHFGFEQRVPQEVEVHVYRIAQELANNILKHASATHVDVQLQKVRGQLLLLVEDNGKGWTPSTDQKGHGITNITSRARLLNGTVSFEPGPEKGTVVTLRVPLS